MTITIIDEEFTYDERMRGILRKLKVTGHQLCVASNSIRPTVNMMLLRKGFTEFFDFFYSNQDVIHSKPNVEMYLRCMIKAGVSPKETVIVEDSHIGRRAAVDSGAHLCAVTGAKDVSYEKIVKTIRLANYDLNSKPK